ncbi:hypothetical protein VPNG_06684 [Cytospora leucostoma]|uniref:Exo-beta-D-glucosaminidase Ig-fold domain-containing protein n=1 Tax=Cytospora leucostoma TaxID=1230097 RepID=A0A423WUT6_9PEZI|nr:hypothetical protein VPNG_06684 [Cytospora leucostoma]
MNISGVNELWQQPDKTQYHKSPSKELSTRRIYNNALWHRYGPPTSSFDYLLKAQMMDYEATRAQFEAYSTRWCAKRAATGMIYWMLNSAWPSLHWNLFDYYMHPAGSYYGAKMGSRMEHLAYDYVQNAVYLINHALDRQGPRNIEVEMIDLRGSLIQNCSNSNTSMLNSTMTNNYIARVPDSTRVLRKHIVYNMKPKTSRKLFETEEVRDIKDVGLLKLVLKDDDDHVLSRNVYWVSGTTDKLDWENSDWLYTPVKEYVDFSSLSKLQTANISVSAKWADSGRNKISVRLENLSQIPAVFIRLELVTPNWEASEGDHKWTDVVPLKWSDNYVTLWPWETLDLKVISRKGFAELYVLLVSGRNLEGFELPIETERA